MTKVTYKEKYTAFFFGEGAKDKKFLEALVSMDKFKDFYGKNWRPQFGNGRGGDPEQVLSDCASAIRGISYDLVFCLIDIDVLKQRYPNTLEAKVNELEEKYSGIIIVWQIDNAEDEYRAVLGKKATRKRKHDLHNLAIANISDFLNTKIWNMIKDSIQNKEKEFNIK